MFMVQDAQNFLSSQSSGSERRRKKIDVEKERKKIEKTPSQKKLKKARVLALRHPSNLYHIWVTKYQLRLLNARARRRSYFSCMRKIYVDIVYIYTPREYNTLTQTCGVDFLGVGCCCERFCVFAVQSNPSPCSQ